VAFRDDATEIQVEDQRSTRAPFAFPETTNLCTARLLPPETAWKPDSRTFTLLATTKTVAGALVAVGRHDVAPLPSRFTSQQPPS